MTNNAVDSTDPFGFSVDRWTSAPTTRGRSATARTPCCTARSARSPAASCATAPPPRSSPPTTRPSRACVYRTGYSGNTGAFFATSTFGSGRVAFWGDSSPIDDGTGQSGNTLYDGWNDTAGTDAALALNATEWLAGAAGSGGTSGGTTTGGTTGGTGTCTAAQLLANSGFESGSASWSATSGVINNDSAEAARTGSYKAWLDGYGTATTDTVSQSVTIPAGCSATLSYYLHIDTDETSTTAYDTLKAEVVSSSGSVLSSLATYSNLQRGERLHPAHLQPEQLRGPDRHHQVHRYGGLQAADVVRHRRHGVNVS